MLLSPIRGEYVGDERPGETLTTPGHLGEERSCGRGARAGLRCVGSSSVLTARCPDPEE